MSSVGTLQPIRPTTSFAGVRIGRLIDSAAVHDRELIGQALLETGSGRHHASIALTGKEAPDDARALRHLTARRGVGNLETERPFELARRQRVLPRRPRLGQLDERVLEVDPAAVRLDLDRRPRQIRGRVDELEAPAANRELVAVLRSGARQLVARALVVDVLRLDVARDLQLRQRVGQRAQPLILRFRCSGGLGAPPSGRSEGERQRPRSPSRVSQSVSFFLRRRMLGWLSSRPDRRRQTLDDRDGAGAQDV